MDTMRFKEKLGVQVARNPLILPDSLPLRGIFNLEHWREGKHFADIIVPNGISNVGKLLLLDAMFFGTSPITSWYFGLIDGNGGTPTLASADTLASHSGWTENTDYSGGSRIQWVTVTATTSGSTNSITNSSASQFNMTTNSNIIYGVFICSATSGTSGTLWSSAAFSSPVTTNNGDQLKITYTVSC